MQVFKDAGNLGAIKGGMRGIKIANSAVVGE